MPMHARVVRSRVSPERLDEFAAGVEGAAAEIQGLAGFRHGYVLLDRQRGEALTITLWESAEQRDAAAPVARQILGAAATATGAAVGELSGCEVGADIPPARSDRTP